ncbi:restriction endonuclease subunit S [Vibrio atypicus]|uniref:restriction endonuclease subunit S n=1 Tax=Vibrio atypicus TaxID=558271 RepID=UPI00135AB6E2|nr:restriction endonuclease subunit S [Vibrio atypicus]
MTGRYKAYPEYKDSGIEWVGDIPKDWSMWKLAHAFNEIGSGTTPPTSNEEWFKGDIPWITTGELREKVIVDTKKKLTKDTLKAFPTLRKYPVGSVAIAMYGATIGRLGILGVEATTNQACCVMTHSKQINNKYLFYWLWAFKEDIIRLSSGGGQPNINQEKVASLRVSAPVSKEQQKIANFLDHETAKIDSLITKQEKLIELLKEKRQAVISHAVTKGLNPDAPMKDSGVEWLGEVPEHWDMKRLKYLGEAKNGLTYSPDDVVSQEEGVLVLRSSNIQDAKLSFTDNVYVDMDIPSRIRTKENDLLICSRNGSRKLIGKNALITKEVVDMAFGAFMVIFRSEVNPYLYWVLNSPLFEYQSGSFLTSTINQLTIGNLEGMEVPLPPKNEQEDIKAYLINKTIKFDQLINKAVYKVKLLNERKTALISAAVTGKIDVR